jgi:hypothetical protein
MNIQYCSLKIAINNDTTIGIKIARIIHNSIFDFKSKNRKIDKDASINNIPIIDIIDVEGESNLALDMYKDPKNRGRDSIATFRKKMCVPLSHEIGSINLGWCVSITISISNASSYH